MEKSRKNETTTELGLSRLRGHFRETSRVCIETNVVSYESERLTIVVNE